MDADKCQEDSNAMSEGLESAMEKMGVSETKEQEEPLAAVGEPEQVALNGHHEAEPSPVRDRQKDGFPEEVAESAQAAQTMPEAAPPMETLVQDTPPHVSEKVEEPVVTEAASAAEPAPPQCDGSPETASESPQRETPTDAAEEPAGAGEMPEEVPAQPQPAGSPVKIPEAAERDTPVDASEEMEESPGAEDSMGAEELSEAVLAQHQPAESTAAVSPPDVLTTGTESETPQPEPQLSAESDPEPKVESVPEVAEQTSPEPDSVAQIVDLAIHKEEAPAAAGEVAMDTAVEEASAEKVLTIESPDEKAVAQLSGNPVVSASVTEACPKAPMQTEEAQNVPSAEVLNAKDAEPAKEEEPKKAAEPDSPAPTAMDQVEQKEAHGDQMQPTKAAAEEGVRVPAPGSLAFALLEHEPTLAALRTSRTLVVLRGLPGSGKSFLARAIADSYQSLCAVVSADDHDPASADGCKDLDEAVIARCGPAAGASLVVVDDTNHTHERLVRLAEIAGQSRRLALFLEPRTEWCGDLPQLAKRTGRGLDEAQIQVMKVAYEEVRIPLFYAWFLLQDKIKCTAMDFLKTLDTLDAFKKHLADFPVETEKEVDLEQYFKSDWALHCTTKFCGYGKAKGAKEYAEQAAVRDLYGSVSELSLSALFVTPRSVGARVLLSPAQLALWPADAEKEAEPQVPGAGALPPGSRAHISLGCAGEVQPVQAGLDLLDILALQRSGQQGELVEEMELGSLVYLDKGRWLLTLREPISAVACFSSMYMPKEADETKKEPEKKKKAKCSIL